MKIKEFLDVWADGTHPDIDVYDDVCEELAIAYCSGCELTAEGKERFKDALEYEIEVCEDPNCPVAIVHVDDVEGVWQKKLKKAIEFFYSIAGYCADDDFQKWFVYTD